MRFAYLLLIATLLLPLAGCSVNPVTGKRQLNFYSEEDEIALGAEAHQGIVAQYGILDDPAVAAYVEGIGQRMVPVSHRPNLPFHFTVLDDPVVNAFALPGGYVYITRGILAYLENEAALAGVMGHEIGHVTAQHGVTRMSSQSVFGLGLSLGAAVTQNIPYLGDIANGSAQLILLKYSRDDERQADALGVQYATALHYDTNNMAEFFHTLDRLTPENGGMPGWMSTHPDPGERWVKVRELTTEAWTTTPGPYEIGRERYLDRVDGMDFGANPREGYFAGGVFHHPDLKFRFPIPEGWQTQNTRATVGAFEPQQKAVLLLGSAQQADPAAAASAWLGTEGIEELESGATTMAGQPARRTKVRIPTDQGVLVVLSTFFQYSGVMFVMHGYAAEGDFPQWESALKASMDGFSAETDPAVLGIQPVRIRIVKVQKSATFAEFVADYPLPEGAMIDSVSGLAILNGVEVTDRLTPGQQIKVLVRTKG